MASKLQERGLSACGKQEKGAERGAIFVYKQALSECLKRVPIKNAPLQVLSWHLAST
jgi:hypothetical protein